MVELLLAKQEATGSNPVTRSDVKTVKKIVVAKRKLCQYKT